MKVLSLRRLRPASTIEDRKDFASTFNAVLDSLGVQPGEDFLLAHPAAMDQRAPRGGRCVYCGGSVSEVDGYRRVEGWERITRPRSDTKAFHAPERSGALACPSCVDKLKRGIAPEQESLLTSNAPAV